MLKVVLVNPTPEQIIEEYDTPDYPHIGIGYLASSLELRGFSHTVVDAKLEYISFDKTVGRILSISSDIVGVTAIAHEISFAHTLVASLKNMGCDAIMLIGGLHITALPERTLLDFPNFDTEVIGEAEYTYDEICARIILKKKKNFTDIPGVVFQAGDGTVEFSPECPFIENLDLLPPPVWHFFPLTRKYPIITAQCYHAYCIFCTQSHGHAIRDRNPEKIFDDWEHNATTYSPSMINVHNESFGYHKKLGLEFLDLIIERKLIVRRCVTSMAHIVSPEMLHKMKKAVCFGVGIEFGVRDPDILKSIRKGITIEQKKRVITFICEDYYTGLERL